MNDNSSQTTEVNRLTRTHPAILLMDGDCNFCLACVAWLARRDFKGRLRFAMLQTELGSLLLRNRGFSPDFRESVLLIEGKRISSRSSAILGCFKYLNVLWRWPYALKVVPMRWRDWVYDWIANHREEISRALGIDKASLREHPPMASRFLDR